MADKVVPSNEMKAYQGGEVELQSNFSVMRL